MLQFESSPREPDDTFVSRGYDSVQSNLFHLRAQLLYLILGLPGEESYHNGPIESMQIDKMLIKIMDHGLKIKVEVIDEEPMACNEAV